MFGLEEFFMLASVVIRAPTVLGSSSLSIGPECQFGKVNPTENIKFRFLTLRISLSAMFLKPHS